jgi:protein TonB
MEYIGSNNRKNQAHPANKKPLRPPPFLGRTTKEIAMHFSNMNNGSGSKVTKVAAVAGFHVLLATVFIHSMNTRHITLPKVPEDIMVMLTPEPPPPPPPPPEPPRTVTPKITPPDIVVPKVEVETPPPQDVPQVQATTEPDPTPAQPNQAQSAEAPPAQPSDANTGAMRTAVFADANGCAKPQYPTAAARNGETGTVTLALLVGTDGKVTSSRIQHSSGYRDLDKAAVNALSMCQFKPAMNNGTPEAGWAQLAYVWTLE